MLLTRKLTAMTVAVSKQPPPGIARQGIERQEEGESWTAMSGYDGVGATRCSVSARWFRAGRDGGAARMRISFFAAANSIGRDG
jgi:hypothetical protein